MFSTEIFISNSSPNMTGTAGATPYGSSGVMYGGSGGGWTSNTTLSGLGIYFDASRASNIYNESLTIQPLSSYALMIIKV